MRCIPGFGKEVVGGKIIQIEMCLKRLNMHGQLMTGISFLNFHVLYALFSFYNSFTPTNSHYQILTK